MLGGVPDEEVAGTRGYMGPATAAGAGQELGLGPKPVAELLCLFASFRGQPWEP